ncbi:dihydropyrimidine dehydrogenase subunit A [Asticcacaulis sp. AC460]|uniref:NAD(P)-dependent oxidoreductase n=1 Tax=Asticcacaulis sp. AC460 TaxID=1282360 RepID=UPI0003C3AE5B|nr:NAD(P)-dependent oxidoreductase [Asticcacaulis sp. AC460]ESQ93119.1 dihydropyrimidine dehydrogenase subunit A [Asticcacaulis sp. AC460]
MDTNRFVVEVKKGPAKTDATTRIANFNEIYSDFKPTHASHQASRCAQCGVPFCQHGCPLSNNIPDWLRLTAEGRPQEAYELSAATSTLPEICGRICPQDRLCEGSCVLEQSGWENVTIGSVERYINDLAFEEGWIQPIEPEVERSQSIAIIGAGPAGIAAADRLRTLGYKVTIYDRYDRAGGLLVYGIPSFKLEKHVVARRTDRLAQSGVEFVLNCNIGEDVTFEELREKHDAILVATGVYKARRLSVPTANPTGVVAALDYLITANKISFGDDIADFNSGKLNADGKNVVVVGGGDTAMDCVRTAIRQGAKSVTCVYRRDRANMPGSDREVSNAEEEGVRFEWLSAPKAILDNHGAVAGLRIQRMRLTTPDAQGRQGIEDIHGAEADLPADLIIEALGFEPENLPVMFNEPGLEVTRWGTLKTMAGEFQTTVSGVFAAGDIVRGASLVVWAVREGQDAAADIHHYLSTELLAQPANDDVTSLQHAGAAE